ncbi:7-carboxy-7-deazaguanine synthase [Rubinisphaera margarita]|uniref:7-carboxy-7-deazaguanine synthase n=1 Tax=Rubinisphaera margarita TaxID=2909586 RepID=UPI0036F3B702
MSYHVKEIYHTLQGEGAHAGRPAVFLRFTGCNLWTGRERDRPNAICRFCDTDFLGTDGSNGGAYESAKELAGAVEKAWPPNAGGGRFVVCTGGEPLLQLDSPLIEALHRASFEVAVETNGTRAVPNGVDWICVSPKANADCIVREGDELKLVFPQNGITPEQCAHWGFDRFFLQPMDGPDLDHHRQLAVQYCLSHPQWELSIQTHKLLGLR